MRQRQPDRFEGVVEDVRILGQHYWGKLVLDMGGDVAPVVGNMSGIGIGDSVLVEGFWTTHDRFGRQIKAQTIQAIRPRTESGAIAWMRSRLPNVGPERAKRMVDHFGGVDEFWKMVELSPARLTEIPGITAERAEQIVAAYDEHRATRDRDVRLRSLGLTGNQIGRLTAEWGEGVDIEKRLKADPYQVIGTIRGFGWQRADTIARAAGFPHDAPSRIVAALQHSMDEACAAGHTYLPLEKLARHAAVKVLRSVDVGDVMRQISAAECAGVLRRDDTRATAPRLENAERAIAAAVKMLREKRTEDDLATGRVPEAGLAADSG